MYPAKEKGGKHKSLFRASGVCGNKTCGNGEQHVQVHVRGREVDRSSQAHEGVRSAFGSHVLSDSEYTRPEAYDM